MARVTVHPFAFDETTAREVSSYTDPRINAGVVAALGPSGGFLRLSDAPTHLTQSTVLSLSSSPGFTSWPLSVM